MALHFDIGAAEIGWVPALNQIALAVGILFLLPLGDRYGNRRLVFVFSAMQVACLLTMALATSFTVFTAASTVLGMVTIAPYLLPAYASRRTPPEQLGRVTGLLTAGILFGILAARVGAGIIAEYFGWQIVYWIASGLMLFLVLNLNWMMRAKMVKSDMPENTNTAAQISYWQLLATLPGLMKQYPHAILSGCIQALNFGMFIALWLGLALHLTSDAMGYGVDVVGYLALTAAVSMLTTPRLGKLADRLGPERARFYLSIAQVIAMGLLWPLGHSLALLLIPVILNTVVGPMVDVTGRMTILRVASDIRTRLMTVYVVIMFVGGGFASVLATAAYERAAWNGTTAFTTGFALICLGLSWLAYRNSRQAKQ